MSTVDRAEHGLSAAVRMASVSQRGGRARLAAGGQWRPLRDVRGSGGAREEIAFSISLISFWRPPAIMSRAMACAENRHERTMRISRAGSRPFATVESLHGELDDALVRGHVALLGGLLDAFPLLRLDADVFVQGFGHGDALPEMVSVSGSCGRRPLRNRVQRLICERALALFRSGWRSLRALSQRLTWPQPCWISSSGARILGAASEIAISLQCLRV